MDLIDGNIVTELRRAKRRSNQEVKNEQLIDMILLYAVRFGKTDKIRDQAKSLLFDRHKTMIYQEAQKLAGVTSLIGGARVEEYQSVGTIIAFESYESKYNPCYISTTGKTIKLSTYVFSCASKAMRSLLDESNVVRCTAQKRALRTYLQGGYDNNPVKKKKVEDTFNLHDEKSISKARAKHAALLYVTESLDVLVDEDNKTSMGELVEDENSCTSNDIIYNLMIQEFLETWTDLQKQIYFKKYNEDMSEKDICKELNIDSRECAKNIRMINKMIKEYRNKIEDEELELEI